MFKIKLQKVMYIYIYIYIYIYAVIPRLTSDPANEFFGQRRFFSLFFGLG